MSDARFHRSMAASLRMQKQGLGSREALRDLEMKAADHERQAEAEEVRRDDEAAPREGDRLPRISHRGW